MPPQHRAADQRLPSPHERIPRRAAQRLFHGPPLRQPRRRRNLCHCHDEASRHLPGSHRRLRRRKCPPAAATSDCNKLNLLCLAGTKLGPGLATGHWLLVYFGNKLSTAALGLAITCPAISFPKPFTFATPASTAAFTAATSPLITTVT